MPEVVERTREFIRQAHEDLAESSIYTRAIFLGGVAVVGAHIAGAEALYSNIGVAVFKSTEADPLLTGLAVGGASAALETASTLIVSNSTSRFPRASKWLMQRAYSLEEPQDVLEPQVEPEDTKTKSAEMLATGSLIMGLGSPGYILSEWSKNPDKTFRQNFKIGSKAIGALAAVNFALGTSIAVAVKYAQEIGPTAERLIQKGITHPMLDGIIPSVGLFPLIKSPLTWISLFGASQFLSRRSKLTSREA